MIGEKIGGIAGEIADRPGSEMVEQLARLLRERHRKVGVNCWEEMDAKNRNYWRDEVRFFLVMARQPTEAMVLAARDDTNGQDCSWAWPAMIDAALAEVAP